VNGGRETRRQGDEETRGLEFGICNFVIVNCKFIKLEY